MYPDLALKLPLSRTYFHGSKGVRAIEVLLYTPLDTSILYGQSISEPSCPKHHNFNDVLSQ